MLGKKRKSFRRTKSLSSYKKSLWKIFSEFVRRKYANDDGMVKCISCSTVRHWKEMQAGHCIPKSLGLAIYFDERNVRPQCASCNIAHQGNQYEFMKALEKEYGPDISTELRAQQRNIRQIKKWEYAELIEKYEEKLAKLGERKVLTGYDLPA